MKKAKKWLSLLTAAALVVSSFTVMPTTVKAAADENGVYFSENFDEANVEIIKAVQGPSHGQLESVTKGSFTYSAKGKNQTGNDMDISVAAVSGNVLSITGTRGETSSQRGIAIAFDNRPASMSDISEGNILELSMDVKTNNKFYLYNGAERPNSDTSGIGIDSTVVEAMKDNYVHFRAIIDPTSQKQYVMVSEMDSGKLLYMNVADKTDSEVFGGFTFFNGATNAYLDNIELKQCKRAVGVITVNVNENESGLGDVTVTATGDGASATVTTDASGQAVFVLPDGSYTVEASRTGYEHTPGEKDNDSKQITVAGADQTLDMSLQLMTYTKEPGTVNLSGGQAFIAAARKGSEPSTATAFTASVLDQYNNPMEDLPITWAVYPAGTTTADENVTISDGVVSVANGFQAEDKVAAFDVIAEAEANGKKAQGKSTILVGNSDIIYYENINWTVANGVRNSVKDLAVPVTLHDMSSVTIDVQFPSGTEGQATLVLVSDKGNLAGIQLQSDNTIKAWTGWTGNIAFNQSGDKDAFSNGDVIVEGYDKTKSVPVTFVIDKINKNITVSAGDKSVALPMVVGVDALNGFAHGQYRNTGGVKISSITVEEPDPNSLDILGDADFAKVSGQTITRDYKLSQAVIIPDETFAWDISKKEGTLNTETITIGEGTLRVTDQAEPGEYTITAAGSSNEAKKAEFKVTIGDFQEFKPENIVVSGARNYSVGGDGAYRITKLTDGYGDDVAEYLAQTATWESADPTVIELTESLTPGEAIAKAKKTGKTTVKGTIVNGTKTSTVEVPVNVAAYFITKDATGDSTIIEADTLAAGGQIVGYQITTAKDGKLVKQEVVKEAPTSVDTAGADKVEVAPVFKHAIGVAGDLKKGGGYDFEVPADTYNFTITNKGTDRCDVYVNNQMLVNNMLQYGSTPDTVVVNDIVVKEGVARIATDDYSSGKDEKVANLTVSIVKSPSIVDRVRKVYVLGDSLVAMYYNGGSSTNNVQTGWGQVLQNYMTNDVEVVDLANSGITAFGLLNSAFSQVTASAQPGDLMILESGYNDANRDKEQMVDAVKTMISGARAVGADVVIVTPNASCHDYKADVARAQEMRDIAAETGTDLVDLAKLSYDFLIGVYGAEYTAQENVWSVYNVADRLHSTYNGAHKFASLVAKSLADMDKYSSIIDKKFGYAFTDAKGDTIICSVSEVSEEEKEMIVYKTEQSKAVQAMAMPGDSAAVTKLITDALEAISAATTKEAIDKIVADLPAAIEAQKKLEAESSEAPGSEKPGNSQTGDSQAGDSQTGSSQTGDSQTGDSQTGDSQTGDSQTGSSQTGDSQTGSSQTGNSQTGNSQAGDSQTGNSQTGSSQTGDSQTGSSQTGNSQTGNSQAPTPGSETPGNSQTGSSQAPSAQKVGAKFTTSKNSYKVTKSGKAPTVEFTGTKNTGKTIKIPDTVKDVNGVVYKVTTIGKNAMKNNKKVTAITVGKNVTNIKDNAFANCQKLTKVTINSTALTTIGKTVFNGDKKLNTITIKSTKLKTVGKNALKGTKKNITIKVPKKKVTDYKNKFKNKGQKYYKVKK